MIGALRLPRLPGPVGDAALAAVVAAVILVDPRLGSAPDGGPTLVEYLFLLAGPAVVALRRRVPRLVLLLTLAWVVAYHSQAEPGMIGSLPGLVALYTATRMGHSRFAAAVMGCLVAVIVIGRNAVDPQTVDVDFETALLAAGWFIAAGVMGHTHRQWIAQARQAEERAAEAERTREEVALRRAGEERLRIARELHDSLTHAISIIKVQAGVAVHLARKRGEEVPEALLAIQEASGEAGRELRATLEVLRRPDGTGAGPDALDVPAGRMDSVEELAERARSAGLRVALTVSGERRPLPPLVDRAGYRIVQESLTNALRHAGEATARVAVDYGAQTLTVTVTDDGRARPDTAPIPGTGLLGMRERAVALGGRLAAEPRPDGGFRVHAELPVAALEPAAAPAGEEPA